jgi:hypothetical protein
MDESRSKRTQGSFKGANASSENVKAYQALRRSPPPESVAPGDRTGPPTITADAPRGMTKRTCRAARSVWRPGELLDDKLFGENLINRRLITWQFAGRSRRQPSGELQAAENGGFSETCEPSGVRVRGPCWSGKCPARTHRYQIVAKTWVTTSGRSGCRKVSRSFTPELTLNASASVRCGVMH